VVDQVFLNPNDSAVGADIFFAIPDGAAVERLKMQFDGKEEAAELLEGAAARDYFSRLVQQSKDTGFLEFSSGKLFRVRIAPVPAGAEKRVCVAYHQILPRQNGASNFSYPLNRENIGECRLSVRIRSDQPLKNVFSPTYPLTVAKRDEKTYMASWERKDSIPERDFVLSYASDGRDLGMSLATHKDYFMLLVSPSLGNAGVPEPKDIVFALDVSGSMQGKKIEQARGALKHCLGALNAEDRFAIVAFSGSVRRYREGLARVEAESLEEARRFVDELQPSGSTHIEAALDSALDLIPEQTERPAYVLFLTDGLPTAGETDPRKIARLAREANRGRARLFCFGVGYDVNTILLNQLGNENRGTTEYVMPGEDIEARVSAFYSRVAHPALADPRFAFGSLRIRELYPKVIPDVFHGGQIVLYGKFEGEGRQEIVLTGRSRGREVRQAYQADFGRDEPTHEYIPRFWAMSKVGHLLDEIRINGESKELREEVERISREFGIVVPEPAAAPVAVRGGG
jgi:Ca-activated chloride channel family protein